MRYFANPSTARVRDAMSAGLLDYIAQPDATRDSQHVPGVTWCADNGCYSDRWDEQKWWAWLEQNAHRADTCAFAVAPDIVGDAWRSRMRSQPWLQPIRDLGYPVAYVIQDGAELHPIPWSEFDVLFIGGTTDWKLGPAVRDLVRQAKAREKRVHMGRVNSLRRLRYADAIGCDTADGTYITYGPDVLLPRLLSWLDDVNNQSTLEAL